LKPYHCIYCRRYFHDICQYLIHIRNHKLCIRPDWYCTKGFTRKQTGNANDQATVKPDELFSGSLNMHLQSRIEKKAFFCDVCKKGFKEEPINHICCNKYLDVKPHLRIRREGPYMYSLQKGIQKPFTP
jgi:hypothetical protein